MADEAKPAVAPAKAEEPKAKAAAKITPTPTQDELNQIVEGKFPELAQGPPGGVPEAPFDGQLYGRQSTNGISNNWVPIASNYLPTAGGTATGSITIAPTTTTPQTEPSLILNKTAAAGLNQNCSIKGEVAGVLRWSISLADNTAEGTGNSGSNFAINRYTSAGSLIDAPLTINRSNGTVTVNNFTATGSASLSAASVSGTLSTGGVTNQGTYVTSNTTGLVMTTASFDGTFYVQNVLYNTPGGYSALVLEAFQQVGVRVGWRFAYAGGSALDVYSDMLVAYSTNAQKPGGGPWIDSSDARIKRITGKYTNGLSAIEKLDPVTYQFLGNDRIASVGGRSQSAHRLEAESGKEFIGLIAQDCETVMPELVSQASGFIDGVKVDDLRRLDTGPLVFALINAVKELSARVQALEAK